MGTNPIAADNLARLYFDEGLPLQVIAKRVGLSKWTISDRLRKAGFKLRKGPESRCIATPTAELKRLYFDEELTPQKIADRVGITKGAVLSRLIRAGCKLRPRGSIKGRFKIPGVKTEDLVRAFRDEHLKVTQIARRFGISRPAVTYRLQQKGYALPERKHRVELPDKELLRLYVKEKLSLVAIAKQFHVGDTTVHRRLLALGTEMRGKTDHMKDWHASRKEKLAEAERILALGAHPSAPAKRGRKVTEETKRKIDLVAQRLLGGKSLSAMAPEIYPEKPASAYTNLRRLVSDHRDRIESEVLKRQKPAGPGPKLTLSDLLTKNA